MANDTACQNSGSHLIEYSEPPKNTIGASIIVGNKESSSQFLDKTPIKKPRRLNVSEVKTNIKINTKGCMILITTKNKPDDKIRTPMKTDREVAAQTNHTII